MNLINNLDFAGNGTLYYGTLHKSHAVIDIEVIQHPLAKAYYLCGLSDGFVWKYNTHVAFVPDAGKEVQIDNDRYAWGVCQVKLAKSRYPREKIVSLEVTLADDGRINLRYEKHGEKFERIRRITGI